MYMFFSIDMCLYIHNMYIVVTYVCRLLYVTYKSLNFLILFLIIVLKSLMELYSQVNVLPQTYI